MNDETETEEQEQDATVFVDVHRPPSTIVSDATDTEDTSKDTCEHRGDMDTETEMEFVEVEFY